MSDKDELTNALKGSGEQGTASGDASNTSAPESQAGEQQPQSGAQLTKAEILKIVEEAGFVTQDKATRIAQSFTDKGLARVNQALALLKAGGVENPTLEQAQKVVAEQDKLGSNGGSEVATQATQNQGKVDPAPIQRDLIEKTKAMLIEAKINPAGLTEDDIAKLPQDFSDPEFLGKVDAFIKTKQEGGGAATAAPLTGIRSGASHRDPKTPGLDLIQQAIQGK
jgi:hypothetical protein